MTDTKLTNIFGGKPRYGRKLFGDLKHLLMGYTGSEEVFDIFRKYIVGDVVINRDTSECYTPENSIGKIATLVSKINRRMGKQNDDFELLIAQHRKKNSRLHYIGKYGKVKQLTYKAIGSGTRTADRFCKRLSHSNLKMKQFTKLSYLPIMYLNQFPDSGVGVRPNGIPMMRYLDYTKVWDKQPPQTHIEEFRGYAQEELRRSQHSLQTIVKRAHAEIEQT